MNDRSSGRNWQARGINSVRAHPLRRLFTGARDRPQGVEMGPAATGSIENRSPSG
ncbi:MAG TPA: hypothetical protein VOA41_08745 [Candidatus Dormibacteraeota bacterium]|nr:hypothetical protein [Candidatus Dormibacteraeota bacterium]